MERSPQAFAKKILDVLACFFFSFVFAKSQRNTQTEGELKNKQSRNVFWNRIRQKSVPFLNIADGKIERESALSLPVSRKCHVQHGVRH